MGVKGLWQLLEPTGRPITLESLEGKTLAIDVSIWLHQTMRGMRDQFGNPLPNAHLVGLFHRVCKLLHYNIKPVFVFDGGVPALKRQTMMARKQKKLEAASTSDRTTKKMLENLLKQHAVRTVLKESSGVRNAQDVGTPGLMAVATVPTTRNTKDQDLFVLPPMPVIPETDRDSADIIEDGHDSVQWEERAAAREFIYGEFQNLDEVDTESKEFKMLPPELQHEILTEIKDERKRNHWADISSLPRDSMDFSQYQLAKLMKQSKLSQKIGNVRKEMNMRNTGDLAATLAGEQAAEHIESRRVISEDSSHYILLKGLRKGTQETDSIKDATTTAAATTVSEQPGSSTSTEIDSIKDATAVTTEKVLEQPAPSTSKDSMTKVVKEKEADLLVIDSDSDDDVLTAVMIASLNDNVPSNKPKSSQGEPSVNKASSSYDVISIDCDKTKDNIEINSVSSGNNIVSEPLQKGKLDSIDDDDVKIINEIDSHKFYTAKKQILLVGDDNLIATESFDQDKSSQEEDADYRMEGGFIREESEEEEECVIEKETANKYNPVIVDDELSRDSQTSAIMHTERNSASPNHRKTGRDQENKSPGYETDVLLTGRHELQSDEQTVTVEDEDEAANKEENDICNAHEQNGIASVDSLNEKSQEDSQIESQSVCQRKEEATNAITVESSASESEDEFIEVTIDPEQAVGDDELFPASIFTSTVDLSAEEDTLHSNKEESLTNKPPLAETTHNKEESLTSEPPLAETTQTGSSEPAATQQPQVDIAGPSQQGAPPSETEEMIRIDDEEDTFQTLSTEELLEIQEVLRSENTVLAKERGRQERLATSITDQMHLEAQELLRMFGVPFVVSPMEAEAQCAFLDLASLTQGTITDDSDIWLFGGQRVYKNFFNQNKPVEFFKSSDIHSQLLLDRGKLINIALLCGSDYTEGVEGIGPVLAMEILAEFYGNGVQQLQKLKDWWDMAKSQPKAKKFTKTKNKLRTLSIAEGFPNAGIVKAYLHPAIDDNKDRFSWSMPDLDLLREFTSEKFGWPRTKTDDLLLPVMKQVSKRDTQSHINNFFLPSAIGEPKGLKSKRIKHVLTKMRFNTQVEEPVAATNGSKGKNGRGRKATNVAVSSARKSTFIKNADVKRKTVAGVVNLSESSSDSESDGEDSIGKSSHIQKGIKRTSAVSAAIKGKGSKRARRK